MFHILGSSARETFIKKVFPLPVEQRCQEFFGRSFNVSYDWTIFQIHPACHTSRDTQRARRWNVDNSWSWLADRGAGIRPRRSYGSGTRSWWPPFTAPRVASRRAFCQSSPRRRIITRGTGARCPTSWVWSPWRSTLTSLCCVSIARLLSFN